MTELLITPNYDKKTAKFKGTVAAGETVRVKIVNARDIDIYSLRLRVMEFNGRTLALFERTFPVEEEGAEINWVNDGEHLTCNLDLNTVEMQSAVCGMCERELLVVLDDPENDILHFKSICAFQGWPKRKGGDIPYELGEYPDIVENLKSRVNEAEKSIANHVDKADGIVAQANNVKNAAVKAEEDARQAAASAEAAKEEAERQAQSAAKSADNLQVAVEEARNHKNAAQEAQSAAENARDNAETVAEESAQRLVAAEKSRAEMAENEIRGKVATLIASDTDKSARSIAAEEVAKIVTGAPDDLDTLKEIAAYIESDKTGAAVMAAKISENSNKITLLNDGKVDKVAGKGLSTNDYTTEEKEKLGDIEKGAQKNPDLSEYAKKTDLEGFATEADLLAFYYPDGSVTSMDQITTSGIEYAVGDDGGAYVVLGNDLSGHVVLPWKVDIGGEEYKVTGIGSSAFDGDNHVISFNSFSAPVTVKIIGDSAFFYCTSLTSVSLPSATIIKGSAFAECSSLTSVSLPSATSIEISVFSGCTSLETVNLPSATSVGDYAFAECSSLTSVSLPSATIIGYGAFNYCSSLSTVDFGSSPKSAVPSLFGVAFDEVPTSCKFIIPLGMYDEWIAADGWAGMYAQGYKFEGYASTEQVKEKRDRTDNIAVADSMEFTEWKFHCDVPEIQAALEGVSATGEWRPEYSGWMFPDLPTIDGFEHAYDIDFGGERDSVHLNVKGLYRYEVTGVPVDITATREKVVIAKSGEPYVTPTGVKTLADAQIAPVKDSVENVLAKVEALSEKLPYRFKTPHTTEGDDFTLIVAPRTVASYYVDDTSFTVDVGESEEPDAVRDCALVVNCTDLTTAPTITWPANFHPRTDAETDFACVSEKRNVYWITEYAPNEFTVAGWQETTGGAA